MALEDLRNDVPAVIADDLPTTSEIPLHEATLLLVDDNPAKLFSLESVLSGLNGVRILTATSARQALKLLLNQEFAVILLDVHMPDIDGFELAQMIRQRPRFEATPIIFVTAISTSDTERARGYDLGAVDYLFMPIVPEVLRAKVGALIDLFRKTRQVQLQAEQLAELNRALEAQVRRSAELNEQLMLSNRELEAFTYSVSHDLRSPLKTVQGFCSLLKSECGSAPKAQEYLSFVQAGLERADRLIAGLLNLSRMTRQPLNTQRVDLAELARTLLPELRTGAEQDVEVVVPERLDAYGDPELLGVVLQNLLGNALKFTSKRARGKVELGVIDEDKRRAVFFIRDNGAGFSSDRAHRLFTPFQRLHSQEEFEGTGIGLATVQRVIRRHGGQVWAEATPGEGATFFFTLGE